LVEIEIISQNSGGGGAESHSQLTLRVTLAFRERESQHNVIVAKVTAKVPFCHFHFTSLRLLLLLLLNGRYIYRSGVNSSALLLTFCLPFTTPPLPLLYIQHQHRIPGGFYGFLLHFSLALRLCQNPRFETALRL
jgi:hypothetical protein